MNKIEPSVNLGSVGHPGLHQLDHKNHNEDNPETVSAFFKDGHEPALSVHIFYVASDDRSRITNSLIKNENFQSAVELRDKILSLTTDFVRQQWYRIEVTTPLKNEYGRMEGGFKRMLLEREPQVVKKASANGMRP